MGVHILLLKGAVAYGDMRAPRFGAFQEKLAILSASFDL
jgi:hypothetical protein